MPDFTKQIAAAKKKYIVTKKGERLSCPTDKMQLWNAHPKVYLPIEKLGEVVCPYCSTKYVLK